ncbi:hypothetical protein MKEN_00039700 [Mycena kentingensis (nom. inval.)]|nr:hypothetical protein MKEN_00039700 [Mycena kentingensis (nom. inval.)]
MKSLKHFINSSRRAARSLPARSFPLAAFLYFLFSSPRTGGDFPGAGRISFIAMGRVVEDHSDSRISVSVVQAFIALQLIALFGLIIILVTALASKRVKRNATYYAFISSWILSCIGYTFIFILGQQNAPIYEPCLLQAAMVYGAPVLTGCSTLSIAIDMLLGIRAAATNQPFLRRRMITFALITVPVLMWLIVFIILILYGARNPADVRRGPNGTYCDFEVNWPGQISSVTAVVTMVVLLGIESYVAARFIRNRNLLKDRQLTRMAVRVLVFSVLGALGLGVGLAYVLYSMPGTGFDLIMAMLPVGVVLIFGTQDDLLSVWMFRRHEKTPPSLEEVKAENASKMSASAEV